MSKIILKWWHLLTFGLLFALYVWGSKYMYFHQDDLDFFIMANQSLKGVMMSPLADHINYLFRFLLKFEWDMFHFNYPPYLFVSIVMHFLVLMMIYKLAKATSNRNDLSILSVLLFAINTNWTEVILWFSGQTISISALFILIAMAAVWHKKYRTVSLWLSTFTSALALGLLPATFMVYGVDYKNRRIFKLGTFVILISLMVIYFYKFIATDGTKIELSIPWLIRVCEVMILAIINTVLGRLIIPFDKFETFRILLVSVAVLMCVIQFRKYLKELLTDKWSMYLILQIFFYYLIVAMGRAQYGVGIMRAERYAYLGLALILLFLARVLRKVKIDKYIWIVPMIVIIQVFGLYRRSQDYVVRPQILKRTVEEVQKKNGEIIPDAYLPYEILNDRRLKYGDLMNLIGD